MENPFWTTLSPRRFIADWKRGTRVFKRVSIIITCVACYITIWQFWVWWIYVDKTFVHQTLGKHGFFSTRHRRCSSFHSGSENIYTNLCPLSFVSRCVLSSERGKSDATESIFLLFFSLSLFVFYASHKEPNLVVQQTCGVIAYSWWACFDVSKRDTHIACHHLIIRRSNYRPTELWAYLPVRIHAKVSADWLRLSVRGAFCGRLPVFLAWYLAAKNIACSTFVQCLDRMYISRGKFPLAASSVSIQMSFVQILQNLYKQNCLFLCYEAISIYSCMLTVQTRKSSD